MGSSSATDLTIFPSADVEHFLSLLRVSGLYGSVQPPYIEDWNRHLKRGYKLRYQPMPVMACLGLFYTHHEYALFWRYNDPHLTPQQLNVFVNPEMVAYCLELYMLERQMAKV